MSAILEPIVKGLLQWFYGLLLDLVDYCAKGLLGVMNTDLSYFETRVPVISTMVGVFIAAGWALLIGNLVFQTLKVMLSGLGFEGENPAVLLAKTGIFGFLLLASRQICNIGLGMAGQIISLLQIPSDITLVKVDESMFSGVGSAGWLLVILFGLIMLFPLFKLLFEIGERYVIVAVLTFMSPFAFAMGASKNTNDIFKGWTRMYASMLLMMILNIVFLKLIISAMANVPTGTMQPSSTITNGGNRMKSANNSRFITPIDPPQKFKRGKK